MSDKVMEIEFEDDITIEEVLEELLYYKKIGQTVVCEFQGKKLNNKDIDKLKEEIEKIKLNMTDDEYENYKKEKQTEFDKNRLEEKENPSFGVNK